MRKKERYQQLYRVSPPQGRSNFLRLDMNENPGGLPADFVHSVLKTITPDSLAMYPETGKLRMLLADYLKVGPEQILLSNGSDDALKLIFEVFGDPGRKLISVWPTFAMYMVYGKMMDMRHVQVSYRDDFSINVRDILDEIDSDTAIVSLLNPNNPIGNVYREDEIAAIVEKAQSVGAIVIIDEAYYYFYDHTFIDFCRNTKNVILVRTFSKLCSIAGLRIGYMVSSPEIIQTVFNVQPSYSVNCVALRFAEEILQRQDLLQQLILTEREGRQYIIQMLREYDIPYYAENGNYVFIYCGQDTEKTARALKEKGVLVKTYQSDPLLHEYIRISTGGKIFMEAFWKNFVDVRGIQ